MTTELQQENMPAPADQRTRWMIPLAIILGILGIVLIAIFVWPSSYKYTEMNLGLIGQQVVRENRLTGETNICGAGIWQRIEISSNRISFPDGVTVTVGGENSCARFPWIVTAALACIAIGEAVLLFFILKIKKQPEA